jgi:hypothetical protein
MDTRSIIATGLALLVTLASAKPACAAEGPGKIRVLLVTGDDVQPAHN